MSSSSRNVVAATRLLAAAIGCVLAQSALAAVDGYVIPEADVGAEHHTNIDVRPSGGDVDSEVDGYSGGLGATLGLRSPRGLTEVRPRIDYSRYPDRSELSDPNYYLDLKSTYGFQRDKLKLIGHYSRENSVQAETPEAGFDTFDPNNPLQNTGSRILLQSQTTTRTQLRPEYVHDFTERVGAGVGGIYQIVKFDSDGQTTRRDNDYLQGEGFLTWKLDQRTDLRTGLYSSKFKTDDDTNRTDGNGVNLMLTRSWSPSLSGFIQANGERTEVETRAAAAGSPTTTEKSNSWGFTVGGYRLTPVSTTYLSVGRLLTPSSSGVRAEVDEVHVEYNRNLSERLIATTAFRGSRSRAQGGDTSANGADDDDNDDFVGEVGMRYLITRTWYIAGGYSYVWQRFKSDDTSGHDNVFRIRFGYFGLPPQ